MASPTSNIVLVTGGNQGIGFAIAKKLATDYSDYHIIIGSRDASRGVEAASSLSNLGFSVSSIQLDVTDDTSIAAARQKIEARHERIDVLINNAGISIDREPGDMRARLYRTYNTNVFGAAAVTEEFLPLLRKSTLPRVIFISSSLGSLAEAADFTNPYSNLLLPAYKSSKSALNMLMLHYANMLSEEGFKVNSCCPGYVATNLNGYRGTGSVDEGAINACRLATLGNDGESGTFSNKEGIIPW
ncbi:hypothetical protein POJ06DRAFT_100016 [Lipomyces tetrasporus]|uniref:Uncharacterized protein n=1 Tax=Lipomyces tetrasporus TaxID=54092 RepID=A0AAD7QRI8_9ASCO|nr:uncharacterized protein POJ06DRAFT_100016 [Lipomyces tetrasporus]KAJ8100227.1 hypothetical protein POJ06DRAFT_100016 [Lipomyces tetrasporus]